jgi:hypothetical protein
MCPNYATPSFEQQCCTFWRWLIFEKVFVLQISFESVVRIGIWIFMLRPKNVLWVTTSAHSAIDHSELFRFFDWPSLKWAGLCDLPLMQTLKIPAVKTQVLRNRLVCFYSILSFVNIRFFQSCTYKSTTQVVSQHIYLPNTSVMLFWLACKFFTTRAGN